MRSTDKDLLILQQELAKLKWPGRSELIKKAQARDTKKVENRFVEVRIKDTRRLLPAAKVRDSQTPTASCYDLNVTFQVSNIPHKDAKYNATVTFFGPYVYGLGANGLEKELDAKETFRKHLADGLRTDGSDVRDAFFKGVAVTLAPNAAQDGRSNDPLGADDPVRQAVAEKFRVWIGNSLRKVGGKIRGEFAHAVRATEREVDARAPVPGNRRRCG